MRVFFAISDALDAAWRRTGDFFCSHPELVPLYHRYASGYLDEPALLHGVEAFVSGSMEELMSLMPPCLGVTPRLLQDELERNISLKFRRMKQLEEEKHPLPEQDCLDNIETAIRGSVYMVFRARYNETSAACKEDAVHTALFLFIRNTCYSGMFRYNAAGEFNVPYGGLSYNSKDMRKKLSYFRSASLRERFSRTRIFSLDFEKFFRLSRPEAGDFIFLDPPYDSEFSTYAGNEFTRDDQTRLAHCLFESPARWMLVIKNTAFIFDLYTRNGIRIRSFDKQYRVSFMNRNDRNVTHLLITNY